MTIAGMVVLMCWEMRTTICSGFVPRKRFVRDKISFTRYLVPIERFKWYGISLLWQMVPIERFRRNRMVFKLRFVPRKRFRWNKMVFALRLVLFERISGTNPFTCVIPYRLNVLSGTK